MSVSLYRNNIARLTKEKADLEKRFSDENKKIAGLQRDISTITRSITKSTSLSTLQSKQRQIESKQGALTQAQKKAAELTAKIARVVGDLNSNLQKLERTDDQGRKKQDAASKRRRDNELSHARDVTREIERQARLHSELRRSSLIIDLARLPAKIKVLFLAANPLDQTPLRLDEEIRAITEKIRSSEYRDAVELISQWALRPGDILQGLNEHKPHIVHFSGHGSDTDELLFQDANGNTKLVAKEAIVTTISTVADNIQVIVFNSCFSSGQAEAVTQYVDIAIGMNTDIGDEAARVFAAQFYSAIGFGRSVQQAFDQARAALMLEGIPEDKTPALFTRGGVDAREVILVRPSNTD
jgi:hypothetical protein